MTFCDEDIVPFFGGHLIFICAMHQSVSKVDKEGWMEGRVESNEF